MEIAKTFSGINEIKYYKQRIAITTVLIIACMILTYIFKIQLGIGRIYTHFFYIPIIFAGLWWNRLGIIVAVFLASFLVVFHLIFRMEEVLIFDFFRAIMFLVIGLFVDYLRTQINKSKEEIIKNSARIKASYKPLKESKKKIKEQSKEIERANKELEERVDELEKFHRLTIDRELKMVELKKIIKRMRGNKLK